MDIQSTRRARLSAWITDRHGGKQASFVRETGINQGELSQLLKAKSFGEKKARSIEIAAGMSPGWLDHEPDTDGRIALKVSIREELILEVLRGLTPEQLEVVLNEIRTTRNANLVTGKIMGASLKKTIGNAEMEQTYGLPGSKSPKATTKR